MHGFGAETCECGIGLGGERGCPLHDPETGTEVLAAERALFEASLARASETVKGWPEWKRTVLGGPLASGASDRPELHAHRPSAFAWLRCPGGRFVAVTRRYGSELNAPGGKIERGDLPRTDRQWGSNTPGETPLGAAIRETFEETGIELRPEACVHVCTIGYAHMFLWDMSRDPVLSEPEAGIKVGIVPERLLTHSQYFELFNGPTLDIIREIPRSAAGFAGFAWTQAQPLDRSDRASARMQERRQWARLQCSGPLSPTFAQEELDWVAGSLVLASKAAREEAAVGGFPYMCVSR